MNMWVDYVLTLIVITNLMLLVSNRLNKCIELVAIQGLLLGTLPILAHHGGLVVRPFLLTVAGMGLKGFVFPWLLFRVVRDIDIHKEIEAIVGYISSLVIGIILLVLSLWINSRLPVLHGATSFAVPTAFFTIFTGFLLIITRRRALMQVLGYLVLENGIYAFGVTLAQELPFLIEIGVLLDIFVAIFIMGIMVFRINQEFDHIDTVRLSNLKD